MHIIVVVKESVLLFYVKIEAEINRIVKMEMIMNGLKVNLMDA